ncbi:hypothetical protein GIB67_025145 [Kingdonia uniflora]|uniref:Myosin motor domain-containing protein n=1 Tax=Kingdonia uniflora TaxID=39325 RepID=A0A7J7N7S4_9MAGN|nr:hypothetical protein GIB67_025145 [Kingdonia uniflora]
MFSPPNLTTRSSLETMLDSIRQRDEKPKDIPPALPARPTSKARLPSGRKSLPKNFSFRDELGSEKVHVCSKENEGKKRERSFVNDENLGCRSCGKKNIKTGFVSPAESPYDRKVEEKNSAENFGENGFCDLKPDRSDNLSLVVKKKKLQVWCQSNGQWNSGTIESTSEENAVVMFRNSSVGFATNPYILLFYQVLTVPTGHFVPANPDMLDGIDDLIQLSYLNEPSVLHNLQHRYCHDKIYTKAGPILVAVNPFKDVESFGDELISAYRKNLTGCPHVYSVAETAFSGMMRDKVNQSIIINGETGSGKTETAKIALKYLVAVGGHSGPWHKILQTNFILEAFGNAKTARNDNSSRFGKLVEVNYSTTGKICGTKIETCKAI